ncbi:MOSC domain-containing protein YiiM [Flavobacteriaceae bacterium MAR_2010_188]|nr:MOSC domain-containing protein YiiM [Flavobacteriaceae bacterium MAR_2010_188]
MKILSTNIAEQRTVKWRGKNVKTGIFKCPVEEAIYLGKEDVDKDEVTDRRYHGGIFKACYLFSSEYYAYWKNLYPNLDWQYGMFGENLTVSGMDDSKIMVGSIYQTGTAKVQITIPREPCFKLGLKFGTQKILKQFIQFANPGTYVRIIEEGQVAIGDDMQLIEESDNPVSVKDFFNLFYLAEKNEQHINNLLDIENLPIKMKIKLASYL